MMDQMLYTMLFISAVSPLIIAVIINCLEKRKSSCRPQKHQDVLEVMRRGRLLMRGTLKQE